jgi:hypothetical protein
MISVLNRVSVVLVSARSRQQRVYKCLMVHLMDVGLIGCSDRVNYFRFLEKW